MSADWLAEGEREIELKLLAGPEVLARLRRSPLFNRLAEGRAITRQLLSVYYDTPDLALHRKGLALRVRKVGGAYVQTVKSEDRSGAAASNRAEVESLLPDETPDPALIANETLRRLVTKRVSRSELRPVYETDIRRTERQMVTEAGDRIELAIDTGVIRAADREEPISELELELKSGHPAALYQLALLIAAKYDIRIGMLSKAARGHALAAGESAIKPVKSVPPALHSGLNVEQALCLVLGSCLSQITANEPAVVTGRDPEGIHQMRVGLRRLRSAARSFAGVGLDPWLASLEEEARWFAASLGRARDLDVFLDEMLPPVEAELAGHSGLVRLRSIGEARREAAWTQATGTVTSRRFAAFILSMTAAVEERPWRQSGAAGEDPATKAGTLASPVRDLARRVLQDHYEHVNKEGREFDALTSEGRHALRIELKKLRYNVDFFASVFSKKTAKPFLKALANLQDVFGYLNDMAVAERLSRKLAKAAGEDHKGSLREAAGLVIGWHGHLAASEWTQAKKRWNAFRKLPPFWRP